MKYNCKLKNTLRVAIVLLGVTSFSCKEDVIEPQSIVDGDATTARAVYSQRAVNWNNRANGTYTSSAASSDFGNISGWNDSRAYISSGTCRITLLKNALSGAGGVVSSFDVTDGAAYEMDFELKYHSQFDWSRGGKVGFGFGVGDGNAGGDPAWDGNGGSMRIMWYNNNGRIYLHPYVYHRDQAGQFGDNFGVSYPSSGSITRGTWYKVHMYIKSNTGSNKNGHLQIIINGTVILDQDIRWTTNDSKRLINRVWFQTFRGGSQDYWKSSTDGYIYFDNLWINRIN
jgi:hypothetical protein